MSRTTVLSLRIDHDALVVSRNGDGGRLPWDADKAGWHALRRELRGSRAIRATVAAPATFDLALPTVPGRGDKLQELLAEFAPLLPSDLAATAPRKRGDAAIVTLARRDWLRQRLVQIEREIGATVTAVAADDGAPFVHGMPARARPVLVTVAITFASAVLAAAAFLTTPATNASSLTRATAAPPLFLRPGFSASLRGAADVATPAGKLTAVVQDSTGVTSVQFDTADPEALQSSIAERGSSMRLRQIGQVRLSDGSYRMTLDTAKRTAPLPMRTANALGARSTRDAMKRTAEELRAMATGSGVNLRVTPALHSEPGMLVLALELSGNQSAVVDLVDRIEASGHPMRLLEWRLVPDPAGVRLTGTLGVLWGSSG